MAAATGSARASDSRGGSEAVKGVSPIAGRYHGFYKNGMRRSVSGKFFALLFGLLVLTGCQTLLDSTALQEPIVNLADLRVRDVQLFEQRYTVVLRVQNPNPVELPIRGMSYQMMLNKVELGRGASPQSVVIPPYGESLVEVDLISNTFSLAQRVQEIASGVANGVVRVSINGSMNLSNRTQPLPFSFTGDVGGGRS